MRAEGVRDAFPVLARVAYLNAGTTGPVPAAAATAARAELEREEREGRLRPHMEHRGMLAAGLRARYAGLLGAQERDVALTLSTSDGLVRVLAGLGLGRGDEILTSTVEHPGLYGPLAQMRRRGIRVRCVALADLAECVGPRTRLIACSHVSWTSGQVVSEDVARTGVPVLLDGAQGIGSTPVDVTALGAIAYAGSGQKWLCGPEGTGVLWVHPDWRERIDPFGATYTNLECPQDGVIAAPWPDGRAYDAPVIPPASVAAAAAAFDVLAGIGWERVFADSRARAAGLADRLAERGRTVLPRGDVPLVTWEEPDADGVVARASERGVAIRGFPGLPLVRACTGVWNDDEDVERLLAVV